MKTQRLVTVGRACLVICALLAAPAVLAQEAGPAPAKQIQYVQYPASYVTLYDSILNASVLDKQPPGDQAILGAIAARLWEATKDPQYLQRSLHILDAICAQQDVPANIYDLVWRLQRGGGLDAERSRRITAEIEKTLGSKRIQQTLAEPAKAIDPSGNNLVNWFFLDSAYLCKVNEDHRTPQQAALWKVINDHCSAVLAVGDLNEDASNYDSFGFAKFVDLVRLIGREDELKGSAGMRRVFTRFRDMVSPAGFVPEYGDSYFAHDQCLLDRVYLLEYAAGLYQDPSFAQAAQRHYRRPFNGLPIKDYYVRGLGLIALGTASSPSGATTAPLSTVTYRRQYRKTTDDIDKLVLRTGHEPGAAMIMMDIYAQGSHAHEEKGPSIAYYEAGGVPLFHNMSRHAARSSIAGNILYATPAGEEFPGIWQEGKWHTMSIPVEYLRPDPVAPSPASPPLVSPPTVLPSTGQTAEPDASPNRYLSDFFNLRNFPEYSKACEYLYFDNLRLSGPGGDLLIDGFEATTPPAKATRPAWNRVVMQEAAPTVSPDRTEGEHSQRLSWGPVKGWMPTRLLQLTEQQQTQPIDRAKYSYLKLDLKFTGKKPYMHIRGLGRQIDLGDHCLVATPASAKAEQRGADACGEVTYSMYLQPDCRAVRRLVLTQEGYLLVHDELMAGPSLEGWNAGQLWQLYNLSERGTDWFASGATQPYATCPGHGDPTVERGMVVRYSANPGDLVGDDLIESSRRGQLNTYHTTHASTTIAGQKTLFFSHIVVPYDPRATTPKEAAGRVAIRQDASGAVVATVLPVNPADKPVTLTCSATEWSVSR